MKRSWPVFGALLFAGCYVVSPPPAVGPGPAGGPIQVVAGTYGENCGQPRGNVSAHLAATCNGRGDCAYRVDVRAIGDPAYGCPKSYVAEWTCGGSPAVLRAEAAPEAGYGSVVQLTCAGGYPPPPPPVASAPPPAPPPVPVAPAPPVVAAPGGRIRVLSGTYGQNCRAPRGNVTAHLQQSCEGHHSCGYRVDHKIIGDPAYGCRKDYVAEWQCGQDPTVYRAAAAPEAGFGSVVNLACDGSVPPAR